MAARSIASLSLTFGLVSIPVKVYSGTESKGAVSFNLLAPQWNMSPFDGVFCRNVMIYFDAPTQRRVLQRLHGCIRPGGLLFAGHSENFSQHRDLFELVGKTVYRRVGG